MPTCAPSNAPTVLPKAHTGTQPSPPPPCTTGTQPAECGRPVASPSPKAKTKSVPTSASPLSASTRGQTAKPCTPAALTVRAQIINVPLPESGWRFGDIALHDGAPTGTRPDGQGGEVSVFNAFERWRPSETPTHTAFARCPAAADAEALTGLLEQHGWTTEDWTHSLRYLCLRCSYGIPHEHAADAEQTADKGWQTERSIGIAAPAAQSAELETALQNWAAAAPGREVSDICRQDYPLPARQDGRVWWIGSSE